MPVDYQVVNLRKGSLNVSSFAEKSWNKVNSLCDDFDYNIKSTPNNQSFNENFKLNRRTSLIKPNKLSKNKSFERKKIGKLKPISNTSISITSINSKSISDQRHVVHDVKNNNISNQENENYYIEEVESDDEPKKKVLCSTPQFNSKKRKLPTITKHDDNCLTPTKRNKSIEQIVIGNEITPIRSQKIIHLQVDSSRREKKLASQSKNLSFHEVANDKSDPEDGNYNIENVDSDDESNKIKISKYLPQLNNRNNKRKRFTSMIQPVNSNKISTKRNRTTGDLEIQNELTPIKSQIITEVQSPTKEDASRAQESRCFLKFSKKVEKLLKTSLIKSNLFKNNDQSQTLVNKLLEKMRKTKEEHVNWLSLSKKDNVQRSSLFLRLTNVRSPSNGFVDCDCKIEIDKMKEVILFKYNNLKILLPTVYANEFNLSNQALVEFIGPWFVFDNDKLETSFIINPFWIHILDHGESDYDSDEYEVVYENPNLNLDKLI